MPTVRNWIPSILSLFPVQKWRPWQKRRDSASPRARPRQDLCQHSPASFIRGVSQIRTPGAKLKSTKPSLSAGDVKLMGSVRRATVQMQSSADHSRKGHFPWPEASEWTDEELGIPPDEE
ncbi:hypothetical protein DNTS_007193 [Danionella cerebrum]|uniref:Uncharacterized protein n=1 Tax=Danionella cerebrum TaxID=2873325 RepID=A0A553QR49_9TELE|nr:hypothetical protein DNTS_007193 [Danionella translucida]